LFPFPANKYLAQKAFNLFAICLFLADWAPVPWTLCQEAGKNNKFCVGNLSAATF